VEEVEYSYNIQNIYFVFQNKQNRWNQFYVNVLGIRKHNRKSLYMLITNKIRQLNNYNKTASCIAQDAVILYYLTISGGGCWGGDVGSGPGSPAGGGGTGHMPGSPPLGVYPEAARQVLSIRYNAFRG